jgi:hypothetical protein
MIQPPPSLEGPLRELFKSQEEERYKLRMKHLVEKEKLVLAVEQVSRRLAGSCSIGEPLWLSGHLLEKSQRKPKQSSDAEKVFKWST